MGRAWGREPEGGQGDQLDRTAHSVEFSKYSTLSLIAQEVESVRRIPKCTDS